MISSTSTFGDPVFWAMLGTVLAAVGLLTATGRSIFNYFKKNKVDRLQMYVALVDDLQDELKRLRSDIRIERKENGERIRDLALIIERQMMEIEALRNLNQKDDA